MAHLGRGMAVVMHRSSYLSLSQGGVMTECQISECNIFIARSMHSIVLSIGADFGSFEVPGQTSNGMGFRQNFSGRRRHHVIAPAVLSLSHKHVDGWVTIISVVCSRNGE